MRTRPSGIPRPSPRPRGRAMVYCCGCDVESGDGEDLGVVDDA